jgi:PAS domain S-box-containing protein
VAFVLVLGASVLTIRALRNRDREYALRQTSEAVAAASQESEARLRTTLESIGDGVIATDDEGRVTLMNPVAQALTGWTDAGARGRPIEEVFAIVNEATRQPVENPVAQVRREGSIVGLANHAILLARDGREIPIADSAAPIRLPGSRLQGVVVVFRDVTGQYELERQRASLLQIEQAARQDAEAANRAKDEFVATLSHELRTPLSPILGWVRLLRSGDLDEAATARGLEVIERNVRAQTQLIEDLLDVSRIITGKLRLEVRPMDLVAVVEAGIEAVRPAADAKGIRIESRLDPMASAMVGDPDRLQQVVWNLVSNAMKFTPKEGRVEVELTRVNAHARIRVTDTGKGIPATFLPHVFDRLRQADSTSTRAHGGLGIGLAIVRHLVELHGGTVAAESAGEGKGAIFTVELPVSVTTGTERSAPDAAEHEGPVRLDGVRVMVVDDEADTRDLLSFSLRNYGAEVTALGSASEALAAIQQVKPDVLVSDIGLPGDDGYALIRKVRALDEDRGGRVPAAALTAYAKDEDRNRAIAAGFQAHVTKPVELAQLASVVASLAGRESA